MRSAIPFPSLGAANNGQYQSTAMAPIMQTGRFSANTHSNFSRAKTVNLQLYRLSLWFVLRRRKPLRQLADASRSSMNVLGKIRMIIIITAQWLLHQYLQNQMSNKERLDLPHCTRITEERPVTSSPRQFQPMSSCHLSRLRFPLCHTQAGHQTALHDGRMVSRRLAERNSPMNGISRR